MQLASLLASYGINIPLLKKESSQFRLNPYSEHAQMPAPEVTRHIISKQRHHLTKVETETKMAAGEPD